MIFFQKNKDMCVCMFVCVHNVKPEVGSCQYLDMRHMFMKGTL